MALSDDDGSTLQAVPSFEAIFVEEFPKMVALAAAVSGSRLNAEDIAQEAMSRLQRNWTKVQGFAKPGAWLRRVTINLAISQRRKLLAEAKARLRMGADTASLPPVAAEHEALWAAVRSLPRNQRAAVALYFLEDRTIAEIADILDISPSTARVHLHRARQTLRDQLDRGGLQ